MIPTTRGSLLNQLKNEAAEFAWVDFCEAYRPLLWAWAQKANVPGAEAEELLAEIYAHLVPRLRKFTYSPDQRFRGWLKKAVYSAIADYREKKIRQVGDACDAKILEQVVSDDDVDDLADELDIDMARRLAQADVIVAKVRARLKPNNWTAFHLTCVEGLECQEAAIKLDMTLGQVHVARCRVKAMLAREAEKCS